jgi:DNA-binding NarL/FixJ family response regulator
VLKYVAAGKFLSSLGVCEGDIRTVDANQSIDILLADSHSLFREAVKAVLEAEPDLNVVAEARDGQQAAIEARVHRPDVALLDADLANCDGIKAAEMIVEGVEGCRVIVVAGEEDETILARAVEAGASGYLTKECPMTELIAATRAVHRGETLIPSHLLGGLLARLIRRRREQDAAYHRIARLTRREREVLRLLATGADNDAIGQTLVISPQTARTHIQNVLSKLEVHSRLEAAAFAMRSSILEDLVDARQ